MNAVRQTHVFRRYHSREPSNWRLLPWIILGAVDVGLIGFVVYVLWNWPR